MCRSPLHCSAPQLSTPLYPIIYNIHYVLRTYVCLLFPLLGARFAEHLIEERIREIITYYNLYRQGKLIVGDGSVGLDKIIV